MFTRIEPASVDQSIHKRPRPTGVEPRVACR